MPVLAIMGLSLLGERALADRLHPMLEVDDTGAVGGRWGCLGSAAGC